MNKFIAIIFIIAILSKLDAHVDLENGIQEFVLDTYKIEIPGHPHAFNPSIVIWNSSLLLSFREIIPYSNVEPLNSAGSSKIGLVFLNHDFTIKGEVMILDFTKNDKAFQESCAEDARLVVINDHLYIVYSDNINQKMGLGGYRMCVGELDYIDGEFILISKESLIHFPGESAERREKNWIPFDHNGILLLAYSVLPHQILKPLLDGQGECELISSTSSNISWNWGELRGGTPALRCGSEYLTFFHTSMAMPSSHSKGIAIPHYFIGAYTFQKDFPFAITRISPEPIIGKHFYNGTTYTPYWHPVRVVFPCGYIQNSRHIWLTYGRQDHEVWVAKIDKTGLLNSLVPVEKR